MERARRPRSSSWPTALIIEGFGVGATGSAVGEVCFNTAMTGYEEILTDPSYAGQIVTFTFPHIGVVGANEEDIETVNLAASAGARGAILRADVGEPSNYRATRRLDAWLKARGIIGLTGVDTRALTALIRQRGMPNAVIAHDPDGAVRPRRARGAGAALARHRRHGPRARRRLDAALRLGRDELDARATATASARATPNIASSRSITASSATSCGCSAICGCAVTVVPATAAPRRFWR